MKTKLIHNIETGEITEVELSAEELAQVEADKAADEAHKAARQALLDKLGITADEAKLLLG